MSEKSSHRYNWLYSSLIAGSLAGLCVDVVLFPLDAIKTRLQSPKGFYLSGGLRGIYQGLSIAMVGSVPSSAVFFMSYEYFKMNLKDNISQKDSFVHMASACCGEISACTVRVPIEVLKQRTMVSHGVKPFTILNAILKSEGFIGLYRGYFTTIFREIPFSLIQFPLWEFLKKEYTKKSNKPLQPWHSSLCGAIAGGTAAFLTTPLDVAKTRIMLAQKNSDHSKGNTFRSLLIIHKERGMKGLFAGVVPRTLWISMGGSIFLGVYDAAKNFFS